ncbi:MAG: PEGA domain-containing protein [Myxococcota bacterium]
MFRVWVHLVAVAVGCSVVSPGAAQTSSSTPAASNDDDVRRWDDLKAAGDEAFGARRYREALTHYDAAYAIDPRPALHFNRGRSYEALGAFPEALDEFERFASRASVDLKAKVPKLDELIETMRDRVCTIRIETDPSGAQVLLRGVKIGTTPLGETRVNAGKAEIEVSAPNHLPFRRTVTLPGGRILPLSFSLEPAVRGQVVVKTDPEGATITIDGEPAGLSPLTVQADRGRHEIEISLDGFDTVEDVVTVDPGRDATVNITLTSETPVYEAWWFWTSIGAAVVVGGALTATFVALNTERDPIAGDIDPGLVQAPIRGGSPTGGGGVSLLRLAF